MKKCFISILLTICTVLSLFNVSAMAEEKLYHLTDSITIEYQSYQKSFENDAIWNIEFPLVSGFENKNLERDINQKIRSFFMSGPKVENKVLSLNGSANALLVGSVGVFYADALYSDLDNVVKHWRDSLAIDILTGRVYSLDDLFVDGANNKIKEMLLSLDEKFTSITAYRFTTSGVQFYTDDISDDYLYLSYMKMKDIIDTNGLCYNALTDIKAKSEIVSKLPFKDVSLSHWAYPYIYETYKNGIMTGTKDGFMPDSPMSGAEFCVAILRSMNLKNDAKILYDIIPQGKWYSASLNKTYEIGLLEGLQNDFEYESSITREDAMVIIANALRLENKDSYSDIQSNLILNAFSDSAAIGKSKRDAVAICVKAEIISGSDGKLMPKGQFSRAQVAKILCLLEKLV